MEGVGVSRVRVFTLGCVVYKQTWRKQSGEECARRGEGVREGKKGEERKGTFGGWGGTRGQGPLSLLPLLKSERERQQMK